MNSEKSLDHHIVRVQSGGQSLSFSIYKNEFQIGSDEAVDIQVRDPSASGKHISVRIQGSHIFIRDMGSQSGTFVGDHRLKAYEEVMLEKSHQEVWLGRTILVYISPRNLKNGASQPDVPSIPTSSRAFDSPLQFEIDVMKKNAMMEVENIQADALRVGELLKSEASQEARAIIEQATQESELLREQARNQAEAILLAARQDVAALKGEGIKHADELRKEAQVHKNDALREVEELKARVAQDIASAQEQRDSLVQARDQLQLECQDLVEKLTRQREKTETFVWQSEQDKTKVLLQIREKQSRFDALIQEYSALEQKVLNATHTQSAIERSCFKLEARKVDMENSLQDLDAKKHQIAKEIVNSGEELGLILAEIKVHKEQLAHFDETLMQKHTKWEIERAKHEAFLDSLQVESRVKQLALDATVGEIEVKRIEMERGLQTALTQTRDAERNLVLAKEKTQALENSVSGLQEKIIQSQKELESVQSNKMAQEALFEDSNAKIAATLEDLKKAQRELQEFRRSSETEKSLFLKQIENDVKNSEEHMGRVRTEVEAEMNKIRQELQKEVDKEFVAKGKEMERKLAEARLKEIQKIRQMQDEEKRAAQARLDNILNEIVFSAVELARQRPLGELETEFRDAVGNILQGKTAGTLSVKANERTRQFWKTVIIGTSIPAAIGLIFVIFPGIPGQVKDRFSRTIASERNESGVFLKEIQKRGTKFTPPQDRKYRDSYAENILYLENYVDMKLDEKEQSSWTLILNDFIVGRLGLTDRVIPEFIGTESVMLKELFKVREGILPQFKDLGVTNMAKTEKQENEKILSLLQSDENYKKFRELEKSFYEDYLKRKSAKAALPASPDSTPSPSRDAGGGAY